MSFPQRQKETIDHINQIIKEVKDQIVQFYKDFRSKFESIAPLFDSVEYIDFFGELKNAYTEIIRPKDENDPIKQLCALREEISAGLPQDHLPTCIERAKTIKKNNVCFSWASPGYLVSMLGRINC